MHGTIYCGKFDTRGQENANPSQLNCCIDVQLPELAIGSSGPQFKVHKRVFSVAPERL